MGDIYKFDREDVFRFFQENNIKVARQSNGNELTAVWCPYCKGDNKDKATFSVNLTTGQFECKRAKCGAKGNMITLHKDFGFDLGTDVREYERPSYSWRRFKKPEAPIEPTDAAIEYLNGKRGISKEVIRQYEIKTKKDDDNILAFPFFDENEDLVFIKYRQINYDKSKGGNKEWCERNSKAILFGMKQCNLANTTLIITEGQIDSLSVATAGFENAVSVPTGKNGMTWVPHCWDWIQNFSTIIVFGDLERGEITLLDQIRRRFVDKTIKAVQQESYKDCKDANELLLKYGAEAVQAAVNNARPVMHERIKRLSDIKYPIDDTKKLATGIKELDRVLNGGFSFGSLALCTGKRGDGKTTLSSMIMKEAIEQGYNVLIYSGEMRTGDVKKWLDLQIAGPDRVIAEKVGDYINYHLSQQNIERINRWYLDKAYIFDNSIISDENVDLLPIIQNHILQFDCKVVVIDNLMTAIDMEPGNDDKYERQSQMCKKLARLGQATDTLILLVAHQKKNDGTNDMNDMVSGTSDITNLAGTVISYSRGGKKDDIAEDQRMIRVTKNRATGVCDYKGIVVNYDPASKRIYGNDQSDLDRLHYSACFTSNDFEPVSELESIPF